MRIVGIVLICIGLLTLALPYITFHQARKGAGYRPDRGRGRKEGDVFPSRLSLVQLFS